MIELERNGCDKRGQSDFLFTQTDTSKTQNESPKSSLGPEAFEILCTHDGVLLKKTTAEYMSHLNTSGSISLVKSVECSKRLYIEWHPNDSILIADDSQDQGDWALVDTISRRKRTTSECKVFNTSRPDSNATKTRHIRICLDDLRSIEVKNRGQIIRLLKRTDGSLLSEYFFQHGNADIFVGAMQHLHILDNSNSNGEEFPILTTEKQKLRKTFAELDIGEIKARSIPSESWLPNKVVGFLVNFPDYVPPPFNRSSPKSRPMPSPSEDYQVVESADDSCTSSREETPDKIDIEDASDHTIVNILPERKIIERGLPLTEEQWQEFQTSDGRISDPTRIKEIIFHGGIQMGLRSDVWKYLLNYYQWNDTVVERVQRRKAKSMEYYGMKAQWLSMTTTQERNFSGYRDRKIQIEKDVKRTDRSQEFFAGEDNPNLSILQGILMTYVMYNFDLGYVQGMSDLLAPILAIQGNEVDSFWCFVGFMDMVFGNFDEDQAGMKKQFDQLRRLLKFVNSRLFGYMKAHDSDNMYFCFRWLLVWYKREFNNDDILKLWECLWTRLPCPNFHLLICVAILDQQTDIIIDSKYEFNEILKHVNELSGNIDVKRTLELAHAIYEQIKTFDNLPNDIRSIIGEPLKEPFDDDITNKSCDNFDFEENLVRELTPEERRKQQEQLEEACEQSMFLQFL